MAPRGPRGGVIKVGMRRKDAAIDALVPLGFTKSVISKAIKDLLAVYGGDHGWPFIEEASYKLLIESILENQEDETAAPLLEEGPQAPMLPPQFDDVVNSAPEQVPLLPSEFDYAVTSGPQQVLPGTCDDAGISAQKQVHPGRCDVAGTSAQVQVLPGKYNEAGISAREQGAMHHARCDSAETSAQKQGPVLRRRYVGAGTSIQKQMHVEDDSRTLVEVSHNTRSNVDKKQGPLFRVNCDVAGTSAKRKVPRPKEPEKMKSISEIMVKKPVKVAQTFSSINDHAKKRRSHTFGWISDEEENENFHRISEAFRHAREHKSGCVVKGHKTS